MLEIREEELVALKEECEFWEREADTVHTQKSTNKDYWGRGNLLKIFGFPRATSIMEITPCVGAKRGICDFGMMM